MFLHAIQERFGCISPEAMEWTAPEAGIAADQHLRTGHLLPDVPAGEGGPVPDQNLPHLELRAGRQPRIAGLFLPESWGWTRAKHGPQTTPDGKYTVEFVECLASCGTRAGGDGERGILRGGDASRRRMRFAPGANNEKQSIATIGHKRGDSAENFAVLPFAAGRNVD